MNPIINKVSWENNPLADVKKCIEEMGHNPSEEELKLISKKNRKNNIVNYLYSKLITKQSSCPIDVKKYVYRCCDVALKKYGIREEETLHSYLNLPNNDEDFQKEIDKLKSN